MRKSIKIIILSLTLIVPALVYIFLKSFGENRYVLPFYYDETASIENCGSITGPYQVEIEGITDNEFDFSFIVISREGYTEPIRDLNRLVQKFDNGQLKLLTMGAIEHEGHEAITFNEIELHELQQCVLMLDQNFEAEVSIQNRAVMLDRQNRIRGYYNISEFDEMERIEVEIKVLLQEYTY